MGGDFYDAVGLPDGRLVVFIGDVMGHGVAAAAAMADDRWDDDVTALAIRSTERG